MSAEREGISDTPKRPAAEESEVRAAVAEPPSSRPSPSRIAAFPQPKRALSQASKAPPSPSPPVPAPEDADGTFELSEVRESSEHTPSIQGVIAPPPMPVQEGPAARSDHDEDEISDIEIPIGDPKAETDSIPPPLSLERGPIARFGRFDILGRLAVGGMADLLLARESAEGGASRHAVIKLIRGEFSEDSSFATMFLDEGRLAMRLTHPTICTVYECGREAGRFFIAMEYVEGATLQRVIARAAKSKTPLPLPILLRLFSQVAEALDFAHNVRDAKGRRLRIVHRDVSPNNIMVRYDGVVKLLDFGVAKAERNQSMTQSGAVKGKFSYMSPEQAMSEPVDPRSDIFSLGVCMFEAATGRRLYRRKAQYDVLKAVLQEPAPSILSVREDLPERLDEIILKALEKEPEDRYQSAADLQHDLEALLAEQQVVVNTRAMASQMRALFADEMAAGPELDTSHAVKERFDALLTEVPQASIPAASRGSGRAVWIGAALLAVGALGVGSWIAVGLSTSEPPPAPAAATAQDPAPDEPVVEQREAVLPEPDPIETAEAPSDSTAEPIDSADDALGAVAVDRDPETAPEEDPSTQDTSGRRRRRGRARRRGGSTIVVDPGF